jgi:hypothetical protein
MTHDWKSAHAVCDEALRITQADRNTANGNAEDNFAFIAMTWTALLRARGLLDTTQELDAADVARLMIGLKLCRDANAPHRDNRVDTIGYALCLERVESTETVEPVERGCGTCLRENYEEWVCRQVCCHRAYSPTERSIFSGLTDHWEAKP